MSARAPTSVRLRQHPLRLTVLLATLCTPALAVAQSATYRLQLVRADGAGSCASALQIEREVSRRLGRDPFTDEGERGVDIVMSRSETRWQAKLYLRVDSSDAEDQARLIESDAEDCTELGKSVALAVALAISPELPPEVVQKVEPLCPPPPLPPPPATKPSLHGAASLRLLFSPNLLPTRSLGTALAVTLRGELVGASFGGIFYPENELQSPEAHVGFGVSSAFASGCLWARTHDPQVWSCLGARAGALHSVVYDPRPEQPGDHFWWAASSELGLRQHLFGRAFLEAGAAAVFPFVRHRFQVDASGGAASPAPNRTVYEQGPAVVEGFVGVGLRLD